MKAGGRIRLACAATFERIERRRWDADLALLRARGAAIDPSVKVFGRFRVIGDPSNLRMGPGSTLNEGVFLNTMTRVDIGADVHLSPYAQIHTGALEVDVIPRRHRGAPVILEDHAWIAAGAIVSPGVTVGRGAVVAAGAVVIEDVAPFTLVGGVPAAHIRDLRTDAPNLRSGGVPG